MKKVYVVTAVFGYWDMSEIRTICAFDFEYKAKFYCSKANDLMHRYKPYYESIYKELMGVNVHDRRDDYCHIIDRVDFVSGRFRYEELEIR